MAQTVTRAQIRSRARLFADMRPDGDSEFISNADANDLINARAAEFWDRLVALRGESYFETINTSLPTVANTATIQLPADFLSLLSFDLAWSSARIEAVGKLENIADRYKYNEISFAEGEAKAFRIRGNGANTTYLEIFPTPTTAVNTVIRYVPSFTALATNHSADLSTFDGYNGWDKAIALGVAADMRLAAGLDNSGVLEMLSAELERMDLAAAERSANHPTRVRDVFPEGSPYDSDWMNMRTPAT